MSDNKSFSLNGKDMVCIDTYRILDSCRDKDYFEDVRVLLTERGQNIIDHTGTIRVKGVSTLSAKIDIQPMPFNRGFYQLDIRLYVKLRFEACIAPGESEEFSGIAVLGKKVVLFGSEGNVNIFRSSAENEFCSCAGDGVLPASLPIAVLETVDPLVLDSRIVEPGCSCKFCCCVDEIPDCVCNLIGSRLTDGGDGNRLLVTLGLFSVIRLERPAQYLTQATEYFVPEKECVSAQEEDPSSVFRRMKFPTAEFCPPTFPENDNGCGCDSGTQSRRCCN